MQGCFVFLCVCFSLGEADRWCFGSVTKRGKLKPGVTWRSHALSHRIHGRMERTIRAPRLVFGHSFGCLVQTHIELGPPGSAVEVYRKHGRHVAIEHPSVLRQKVKVTLWSGRRKQTPALPWALGMKTPQKGPPRPHKTRLLRREQARVQTNDHAARAVVRWSCWARFAAALRPRAHPREAWWRQKGTMNPHCRRKTWMHRPSCVR